MVDFFEYFKVSDSFTIVISGKQVHILDPSI